MAWSYRKRITIAPGIRLNISKRGVSTTFGVRGASITMGKNGTYLNTGIPGTGIYSRKKISGASPTRTNLVNVPSNSAKNSDAANGCGILIAILLFISILVIVSENFEGAFSTFWIGCIGVVFIFLIGVLVSAIIDRIRKPSILSKKEELYFQKEIDSAQKALSQATDDTKIEILKSYISCLNLNKKAEEIVPIITALKKKINKRHTKSLYEQLGKYENELSDLNKKLEEVQLDVDARISEDEKGKYKLLCEGFDVLMTSEKLWIVSSSTANSELKSSAGTLVDRKEIELYTGVFNFIKSEFDIPILTDCNGAAYYIYPQWIIKAFSPTSFDIFPIKSIEIKYRTTRFIENGIIPSDTKVIDYTYQYVNKNGGPDKRYSYNPRQPVVGYGCIEMEKLGLSYQISNTEATEKFSDSYQAFIAPQKSICKSGIPENYFNLVDDSVENIIIFYDSLKYSRLFHSFIEESVDFDLRYEGVEITDISEKVRYLFWMDVIKCHIELGHPIDLNRREGLGLLLFISRTMGIERINYEYLSVLSDKYKKSAEDFISYMKIVIESINISRNKFVVSEILGKYDSELQKKYFVLLYRFASIIAKADGAVSDTEKKWLSELLTLTKENDLFSTLIENDSLFKDAAYFIVEKQQGSTSLIQRKFAIGYNRAGRIMDQLEYAGIVGPFYGSSPREVLVNSLSELDILLNRKNIGSTSCHDNEVVHSEENPQKASTSIYQPKANPLEELHSLIGLDFVKSEIATLMNYVKIQQARESKGLKSSQLSYHCVFTGNPGTGKTTVARIVAEIYKDLGILKKGHLVETDRSGLVAEYVGQTAVKTNTIIDSALDGVLFIDEAYSLVSDGRYDYGKEAIATLLKRMEDNRDRLVVILAGYTNEMKEFIDSNPGLQSRFNRYIDFSDYTESELYEIFELNLKKFDYTISNEAREALKQYLRNAVCGRDCNFGNARFVRNLFEKTLENQANRLASEVCLTTEKLSEIEIEDILQSTLVLKEK